MSGKKAARRHAQLRMEYRQKRLERRYRRLLSLYPADHRREHAEEMVGVLLEAAGDGRRRFDLADAADLLAGAVRIRMRMLRTHLRDPRWPGNSMRDPRWADALAVASVAFPLLLVVAALAEMGLPQAAVSELTGQGPGVLSGGYLGMWPLTFGAPLTALLVLLRLRRIAGCAALLTAISLIVMAPELWGTYADPGLAVAVFLSAVAAGALFCSPGPARGLVLLRWWGAAVIAAGALIMAALTAGTVWPCCDWPSAPLAQAGAGLTSAFTVDISVGGSVGDDIAAMVVVGVLAVIALACLRAPVSRRVLMLLLVPAIPYVFILLGIFQDTSYIGNGLPPGDEYPLLLLYLPPVLLVILIVAVARIGRARRVPS
jgi:hypothetical protein